MAASKYPRSLRQRLQQAALALFATVVLLYPTDWVIWHLRKLAGNGEGSVEVTQTIAGTLKGNRYEVFSQQVTTVACSRSLLPEAGAGACWWLRQHPQIVTQY